jgi:UDP-glucose 4-epimerase
MYAAPADGFEVREGDPLDPQSPYSRSKLMMEQVLTDVAAATDLRAILLRYFNPIGSDPELSTGVYAKEPSHILGQLVRAALGHQEAFTITGTEHPTPDGTGIRDYVHVWDLARAHVHAVRRFDELFSTPGMGRHVVVNLGSGTGTTVLELIEAFSAVTGADLTIRRSGRRNGDVSGGYAGWQRAHSLLGWRPELTVVDGIHDAVRWRFTR